MIECSVLIEAMLEIKNSEEECIENAQNSDDMEFNYFKDIKGCNSSKDRQFKRLLELCDNFPVDYIDQESNHFQNDSIKEIVGLVTKCNNHRFDSFEEAYSFLMLGQCGDFAFFPSDSISQHLKNPYLMSVQKLFLSNNPQFFLGGSIGFHLCDEKDQIFCEDNHKIVKYLNSIFTTEEVAFVINVFADVSLRGGLEWLEFHHKNSSSMVLPGEWHFDHVPSSNVGYNLLIPLTDPGTEFCQLEMQDKSGFYYFDAKKRSEFSIYCNEQMRIKFQLKDNEAVIYSNVYGFHRAPSFEGQRSFIRAIL